MKKVLLFLNAILTIGAYAQPGYINYTSSGTDLIEVPANSTLNFQNDFTISLKVSFTNVNFWNMLFCYNKFGGLEFSYTGTNSNNPKTLQFSTDGSAANVPTAKSWTPSNNTWYHVVLTKQGTKYSTYVDGTLIGTNTSSAAIPNFSANKLRIGNYMTSGLFFMGKMDEVSVWSTSLSSKFIKDTLSSKLLGNENGLILYYDMDTSGTGQGIKVRNKAKATGSALDGVTVGKSSSPYFTQTSAVTAIKSNKNAVILYPNPSKGVISLSSDLSYSEVKIYNLIGECIQTIKPVGSYATIDLSGEPQGIYLYRLMNGNTTLKSGKIIIER